jgi:molybdopterin-guanine dinucleotide biosynthesis protein A
LKPELHGLVLAGGSSSRMGRDKAEIAYGALPQWRAVADLLAGECTHVWWSCTERQRADWGIRDAAILDQQHGLGPAGGLHAAFTRNAGVAWLVLACDYPNLGAADVARLVAARGDGVEAIAFTHAGSGAIEPLLSIWEPSAQQAFLRAFAGGERSPRRALESVALRTVMPANACALEDRDAP